MSLRRVRPGTFMPIRRNRKCQYNTKRNGTRNVRTRTNRRLIPSTLTSSQRTRRGIRTSNQSLTMSPRLRLNPSPQRTGRHHKPNTLRVSRGNIRTLNGGRHLPNVGQYRFSGRTFDSVTRQRMQRRSVQLIRIRRLNTVNNNGARINGTIRRPFK